MKKQKPLITYDDVKEKALRLLEFRAHSEYELQFKLKQRGACDEHIENVLEFCRRYGFLNDEAYAQAKARDLINLKKYGIRRVTSELKSKGIPDAIIQQVVCDIDGDSQKETLEMLVEKKLKGDFSDKNKDKCIRYFIYRGYDLYDIKDAIYLLKERTSYIDEM